jgi:hypothetical protein
MSGKKSGGRRERSECVMVNNTDMHERGVRYWCLLLIFTYTRIDMAYLANGSTKQQRRESIPIIRLKSHVW